MPLSARIEFLPVCALTIAGIVPAYAQDHMRITGLVDIGVLVNDHAPGGRQTYVNSNGMNGNRLAFSGRENLGGGASVVFMLETGWDGSTGEIGFGNRFFGSQSYVGIESQYGSLLAGRQTNVDMWTVGLLGAASQWSGLAGTHPGDNDNFYNTFRVPNAIKYISPRVNGFQVQGLYGLGEMQGSTGRVAATGVTYEAGGLKLAASLSNSSNPNMGLAAGTGTGAPVPSTNFFNSPIVSGYASARSWNVAAVGANYTIGKTTLGFMHSDSQFRDLGDLNSGPNPAGYFGTAKFKNHEFSVSQMLTSSWQIGAEYALTQRNSVGTAAQPQGTGNATYRHFAAATRYYLSKRTFLYFVTANQRADGTGSTNRAAVAQINGAIASARADQHNYRIGIQHRF